LVTDVAGEEETIRIINKEHARAHRNPKEMKLQILEKLYFPRMSSRLRSLVTAPETIVSDNERGLLCPTVLNYLQSLGITVFYTPSQKSEVNGQVERFHSTFLEIYLCLKNDNRNLKVTELVFIAVDRYNHSIHSVTNSKPVDIFFNRTS